MIVAISREYGAGSLAVGEAVARALAYRLVTDEVPPEVARAVGLEADEIDARAESPAPLGERLLGRMGFATPELGLVAGSGTVPDVDSRVRREIERDLRERARDGDVVVIGRLGSEVLAGTPGLLRAFLRGDPAWRAARLADHLELTPAAAAAERDRIDADRRLVARERYRIAFGEARHYDMVLNVSSLGIAGTAAAIVAVVRAAPKRA